MTTTRQTVPESGNPSQCLPTGFDPGNGSAKLRIDGAEIRIPSLIQPIHGDIYDVPQVKDGALITYHSGTRKDLEKTSWLAGESAYSYNPINCQKIVDDRAGKVNFGLQILLGSIGCLSFRPKWNLGLVLSIQDAKVFGDELAKSIAGHHVIGINNSSAVTHIDIDVLAVREEGEGAIISAASTAVINPKDQTILIDAGHGTLISSVFGTGGKLIKRTVTPGGVSALIDAIAQNIETRRQLKREGDRHLIRLAIENNSFQYGHTDWNFRGVYNTELKPWVVSNLASALKAVDEYRESSASIVAIGGGSMLPAISQLLAKQSIATLPDGCMANVRGLERIANIKLRRAA
jgi:hypothetical protein